MLNLAEVILLASLITLNPGDKPDTFPTYAHSQPVQTISSHTISLTNRYPSERVNEVFKFNILLNAGYLAGQNFNGKKPEMSDVDKPLNYSFTLKPGETFTFHDQVLEKYEGKVVKTTNSQFNAKQGFKSDGYLYGDGVCHLASLLNWAASDAGLKVEAPANHDFRPIPDIPKEYGTAILYAYNRQANERENLYITNTKETDVTFSVNYRSDQLNVSIVD